jgi:bacterioferritin
LTVGELGRQLAGTSRARLIKDLTRAYADEWFAHYNFQFTANALWGHYSPSTTALLTRKSGEALARANRLAQRILQLGGQPIPKLTDLIDHATDKPFKLPKSVTDMHAVLKAVLDAERTSLRTYHRLYQRTRESDPVTALIAQEYLAATVEGEEELERLIGDHAPGMKGT